MTCGSFLAGLTSVVAWSDCSSRGPHVLRGVIIYAGEENLGGAGWRVELHVSCIYCHLCAWMVYLNNEACDSGFVGFCWGLLSTYFTAILQGYFTGSGAIIHLAHCQWSNPEEYGWMDHRTSSQLMIWAGLKTTQYDHVPVWWALPCTLSRQRELDLDGDGTTAGVRGVPHHVLITIRWVSAGQYLPGSLAYWVNMRQLKWRQYLPGSLAYWVIWGN